MTEKPIVQNLTSQSLDAVIEYIRENDLKAGDFLPTEVEFLKEINCSRTTLREVLAYLKGLGVVTSRRGSGFRIAEVNVSNIIETVIPLAFSTASDLNELLELRRCLELGCIQDAVHNATPEDIEKIRIAAEAYEKASQPEAEFDGRLLGKCEADFHAAIAAPAKSSFSGVIERTIQEYFNTLWRNTEDKESFIVEGLEQVHTEHRAIYHAFAAKNSVAAQSLLRQHFAGVSPKDLF